MRKYIWGYLLLLFTFSTGFAQELSKEEEKAWAKKKKEMSVEAFKGTVEESEEAKNQVTKLESELATIKTDNIQLQSEVEDYRRAAEDAAEQLRKKQQKLDEAGKQPEPGSAVSNYDKYQGVNTAGVVFKVQVGAFKKFDITKYFDRHQNFSGEIDADGTMKYTLGVFSDYWEADKFKKYMREMGVKGAWIVSYKNGKRVNIKDVLEGNH